MTLVIGSSVIGGVYAVKIATYEIETYPNLKLGAPETSAGDLRVLLSLQGAFGSKNGTCIERGFGKNTQNAVLIFQKSKGLTPDGVVGQKTWQALLDFPVLKLGSKGTMVKNLQQYLNFYYELQAIKQVLAKMPTKAKATRALKLKADGLFGKSTEARIKEQQKANKLTANGVINVQTWRVFVFYMERCLD